MENASAAFLDAVRQSMTAICIAVGDVTLDSERLTCAERLPYEDCLPSGATGEAILSLSRKGMPITTIAQTTGQCGKLVGDVPRGLTVDAFRACQSSLDAYSPRSGAEWLAACRKRAKPLRRLQASGITDSPRAVEGSAGPRLKPVKRPMVGRAKLDPLEARLIGFA